MSKTGPPSPVDSLPDFDKESMPDTPPGISMEECRQSGAEGSMDVDADSGMLIKQEQPPPAKLPSGASETLACVNRVSADRQKGIEMQDGFPPSWDEVKQWAEYSVAKAETPQHAAALFLACLLYTSPSPRD